MSAARIAVAVHVYYEDMWPLIAGYLRNIPDVFDLFVTCRDEIGDTLAAAVGADFPAAEVIAVPNVGMDVIPFVSLCRMRRLDRYRAVLKLHTKNRKSDLRRFQGDLMFEGLCGSRALVRDILDVFDRDPNAGMVGGAFQVRSANALMYGNRDRVDALMRLLGIGLGDWAFFSGTMFWIAGPLLQEIALRADDLLEVASKDASVGSGKDGTTAHALERLFGALPVAARRNVYVSERADPAGKKFLVMPIERHGPCNDWRYLQSESVDALVRLESAGRGSAVIARSGRFDAAFYARAQGRLVVPGMDPIYHFYLFGDMFGIDPSPDFSVNFYLANRMDVARKKICSFQHYVQSGRKEGVPSTPSIRDWIAAASNKGMFNAQFYRDTYPDVDRTGLAPDEHYERIGRFLGRRTSRSLTLDDVPSVAALPPEDRLAHYMAHDQRDEGLLYDAITKASAEGDYRFVESCEGLVSGRFGNTPAVLEGRATHATISGDWEAAAAIWERYWQQRKLRAVPNRHRRTITRIDRPTARNAEVFETVPAAGVPAAGRRICIYTTLFGDIDDLVPVIAPVPGVDYICFTDRPREDCGWRQVVCQPGMGSANLDAKSFKILPHLHLADYDYSMFVDANTLFLGNVARLIEVCLQGGDWVMFRHPLRDDVYLEGCAIIGHLRHAPGKILAQIRAYADEGLPRHSGMIEASFIWRRHASAEVAGFMDAWWQEILSRSPRDQLSLGYLLWKSGVRPKVLPDAVGTSRDNRFFYKLPHRDGKNLRAAPERRIRVRDIDFVFAPEHVATGSTFLRGQQLSTIIGAHFPAREVRFTPDTDQRGRILVLTKGFLKTTTADDLARMRQNNVLIADFVDEPPMPDLVEHVDALMASSLRGYKSYMIRFPEKEAFHVTHHVDLRIDAGSAARRTFSAGYFGELVNTVIDDDISSHVAFNLVDTSKQTDDWLKAIGGFSFHYAMRRSRGIDGAKPFLKGFVAAHCGANMMIQADAGDAGYYLGDDYPYLLPANSTNAQIVESLRFARDTFGGPEWRHGMDIMRNVRARSDRSHVAQEFGRMIAAF